MTRMKYACSIAMGPIDQLIEIARTAEEVGFDSIANNIGELTENLSRLASHQRDVLKQARQESDAIAKLIMDLTLETSVLTVLAALVASWAGLGFLM